MKKRYKVLIIAVILLLITGCTKTIKDGKKAVTFDETGQTLTANILCKPTNEELYKEYEEYNDKLTVKLNDLPTCKSFTPKKIKYVSLWETIFIKPLAWCILKLGYAVKNMGISVMIIGLLIRLIMMPIQFKTVKQSEAMKKIQPEMEKIERKYKNKSNNHTKISSQQGINTINHSFSSLSKVFYHIYPHYQQIFNSQCGKSYPLIHKKKLITLINIKKVKE